MENLRARKGPKIHRIPLFYFSTEGTLADLGNSVAELIG